MRICCIVSSLGAGGAERVISLLANEWAARGRDVTIVTLSVAECDAFALDHRVGRLSLDLERESRWLGQAVKHNAIKIRSLRRAVASLEPHVVITFVDTVNVLALLSCAGLGVPVVISERVHPTHHDLGRLWSLLRRLTYPLADALVVQSEAIRAWAEGVVPMRRVHVIPNPVGGKFAAGGRQVQSARRSVVLAVGRLVPQKGFDLLIKAFRVLVTRHREWSLVLIGRGPEEAELRRLAAELLPEGEVSFLGVVKDLQPYYETASICVIPSRFEGFPNVLVEAMASGCAVIAADCPGATSEIVQHGTNGLLVPPEDVGALAREMERLFGDDSERNRLGARAVEVVSRFRVDKIADLWEEVISRVRH